MVIDIFYQKPYCKICYLSDAKTITVELIGNFDNNQYKDIFNNTLKAVLEKSASALILDQTHSKGGNMDSRAWLIMTWLPELKSKVNNPNFRIAGINKEKVGFKKFIADYLEKAAKKLLPYEIKACTSMEEAIEWVSK